MQEYREDVTQTMGDDVCITEGQSHHASCVGHGTRKCHQVWTKHKSRTHFRGQDNIIQKWATDGHIALIGHWCQHIAFRNTKTTHKVAVDHGPHARNNFLLEYEVKQDLGCKNKRINETMKNKLKWKNTLVCVSLNSAQLKLSCPIFPTKWPYILLETRRTRGVKELAGLLIPREWILSH